MKYLKKDVIDLRKCFIEFDDQTSYLAIEKFFRKYIQFFINININYILYFEIIYVYNKYKIKY